MNRYRILAVDDDFDIRALLEGTLGGDYEVVTASNGQDALNKLAKVQPDLVIADLMMPVVDGWEFVARLRATEGYHDVPIFLVSALNSKEDIKKGYQFGAAVYLTKPFDLGRLKKSVELTLAKRQPKLKAIAFADLRHMLAPQRHPGSARPAGSANEEHQASGPSPGSSSSRRGPIPQAPPPEVTYPSLPPQQPSADSAPRTGSSGSTSRAYPPVRPAVAASAASLPTESSENPTRNRPDETPESSAPTISREGIAHEPHSADPVMPSGPRPRVFIIDDDPDSAEVIRLALEGIYEIVTARDGIEAMRLMPEVQPDLFIIDAMMPRMNGYQLVDSIRQTPDVSRAPVVFVSAKDLSRERGALAQRGIHHYLTKPVRPEEIIRLMHTVVTTPPFSVRPKKTHIMNLLKMLAVERAKEMEKVTTKPSRETYQQLGSFLRNNMKKDPFKR